MRCFPSGGGSHIENALVGLWREGDDGKEGGGGLEHIVTGKVLGCSTYDGIRVEALNLVVCDLPIGTLLSKT